MAEDSRALEPDRRPAGKFEMDQTVFRPDRQQREYPAVIVPAEPVVRRRRYLAERDPAQHPLIGNLAGRRAEPVFPAKPVRDEQKAALLRRISEIADGNERVLQTG